LRRYLAWRRTDFLLAMTALGGVVFTTALTGMAIAVALSLLAILYQASRPYIAVLGRIPGRPPVYPGAGRTAQRGARGTPGAPPGLRPRRAARAPRAGRRLPRPAPERSPHVRQRRCR